MTMSSSSEVDAEDRTGTTGVPDVVRILLEDRRKRGDELPEEAKRKTDTPDEAHGRAVRNDETLSGRVRHVAKATTAMDLVRAEISSCCLSSR